MLVNFRTCYLQEVWHVDHIGAALCNGFCRGPTCWLLLVEEMPHGKWEWLLWEVSWNFTFLFCDSHSRPTGSDPWHIKSEQTAWTSVLLFISLPFQSILEIAARLIPKILSPYQSLAPNILWLLYWLQDEVQIAQPSIQSPP